MDVSQFFFVSTRYFLLLSVFLPSSMVVANNNITDLEALLAFKAGVADPLGVLSTNWTTGTSFCTWIGVSCSLRRQRVVALQMENITLYGTISPRIANLSFLSVLDLTSNYLGGSIPESLAQMPRLSILALQDNQLSGSIPPAIFNMSKLEILSFAINSISGTLPLNHSIPTLLPAIQFISLSSNNLSGYIPSSISQCRQLQNLHLPFNNFIGSIPPEIGNLQQLQQLSLAVNNLVSTIPPSLTNLTNLVELDLSVNEIHGIVPKDLGGLSNLEKLIISEAYLTGPLPSSLSNITSLQILDLTSNGLTGPMMHVKFENMPQLTTLFIGKNELAGGFEFLSSLSNCRKLKSLDLGDNELDGTLPNTIGNLSTNLELFYIDLNHIKGNIPAAIGNLSSFTDFSLGNNELVGTIPSEIVMLQNLQSLLLNGNRLYGHILPELGKLRNLNTLDLHGNMFSGSIPYSLGNVSRLQHLRLNANLLSSKIPESLWTLTGLITLDLSQNVLAGLLSLGIGNLKSLDKLNVSVNQLSGDIPSTFQELQMLTYLDLSNNSFGGLIPQSFGKLINIQSLNLSCNNLTGGIPDALANLRYLSYINLSFNELEGKIPNGGVFRNLTAASLVGNAALCGSGRLGFVPCQTNDTASTSAGKRLRLLKYLLPTIVSTIILFLCLYLLFKFLGKRTDCPTPTTDPPSANINHRLISYHELVRATENFSDANLLGRGSFGSVYKGFLDGGLVVAIKVLNLETDGASESFNVECQALRMVRHRNLVKIINTCSNLDFKALVLQFMPNGSLERWLYSYNCFLNLLQRINIVVDIASALEYLHHGHSHVVVHCDLKPSNVLLNEDMTAHVGDFGIAKLLPADSFTLRTASAPGTIGYMAPEYASTGRVSGKADVYSFGILLLEIFTRKKPTDPMFAGELSLRRWVCDAYPTSLFEIVDNNILEGEYGNERQIEDLMSNLSSIIGLGIVCSSESPKERPPMNEVVPKLQKIKNDYLLKFKHSIVSEN